MLFNNTFLKSITNKINIDKKYTTLINKIPKNIENFNNIIIYGAPGIGKYSIALKIIEKYSESNLNYYDKLTIDYDNDKTHSIVMSDIHFELDIELLGVNCKSLFNMIINNIIDIVKIRKSKTAIILCKNFHNINDELHEIIYSYIQTNFINKNIKLKFIFLTECLSFIDKNIINSSNLISIKRPKKINIINNEIFNNETNNIKEIIINNKNYNRNKKLINEIKNEILNYKNIDFVKIRELLYDILIYQLNVYDFFYDLLKELYNNKIISINKLNIITNKLYEIILYYNNNYRPIFHLEIIILFIIKQINEL